MSQFGACLNTSLSADFQRYVNAVKQEAVRYWNTGNEPVEIIRVWIDNVDGSNQDDIEVVVKVSWISESTKDNLRDDMIYTVTMLEGDELSVHGPEW